MEGLAANGNGIRAGGNGENTGEPSVVIEDPTANESHTGGDGEGVEPTAAFEGL